MTRLPHALDASVVVVTAAVTEQTAVHLPDAWERTACRQPLSGYPFQIPAGSAGALAATFCGSCWPTQIGANR